MSLENFIIIVILLCSVGGIVYYLYKAKKRGETCIGCPYAKQCGGKAAGAHKKAAVADGKPGACGGSATGGCTGGT